MNHCSQEDMARRTSVLLVLVFLAYLGGSHAEEEYYYHYSGDYYDDHNDYFATVDLLPSVVPLCPGPDESIDICTTWYYGEGGLNIEF